MRTLTTATRFSFSLLRAPHSSLSLTRRTASSIPLSASSLAKTPSRGRVYFLAAATATVGAGFLWSLDHRFLSASDDKRSPSQASLDPIHRAQLEQAVDDAMRAIDYDRQYTAAVEILKTAANQGLAVAQFNLGVMHATGRGVDVDEREAVRLYKLASLQGNTDAQCVLALMHASGRGTERSDEAAAAQFTLAAARGDSFAQVNLANMFEVGKGVPQDTQKAVELYRQAAAQGCLTSTRALKRLGA